jgi:hypothetical protein
MKVCDRLSWLASTGHFVNISVCEDTDRGMDEGLWECEPRRKYFDIIINL